MEMDVAILNLIRSSTVCRQVLQYKSHMCPANHKRHMRIVRVDPI